MYIFHSPSILFLHGRAYTYSSPTFSPGLAKHRLKIEESLAPLHSPCGIKASHWRRFHWSTRSIPSEDSHGVQDHIWVKAPTKHNNSLTLDLRKNLHLCSSVPFEFARNHSNVRCESTFYKCVSFASLVIHVLLVCFSFCSSFCGHASRVVVLVFGGSSVWLGLPSRPMFHPCMVVVTAVLGVLVRRQGGGGILEPE